MELDYLKSKDLHCVPYGERYRNLSEIFDEDFDAIIAVLAQAPLCVEGQDHVNSRKAMALLIASRLKHVRNQIPAMIDMYCAKLDTPGTIDLMGHVINPLVHNFLDLIAGAALTLDQNSDISSVFSKTNGMRKRRKINEQIASLQDKLRASFPNQSDVDIQRKIVVGVLGNDALCGTLGATLYHIFENADRMPLSKLAYPNIPNYSGVKFVDRIAMQDTVVCKHALQAGQEFEVKFDELHKRTTESEKMALFGGGRHTCLGKGISMDLWDGLVLNLKQKHIMCTVRSYKERKDHVFRIPEEFIVEVSCV